MSKWRLYREGGTFNRIYISDDDKFILKKQKHKNEETDTPERSVRLWNEINAGIEPKAYTTNLDKLGKAWVCPFIEGIQASDDEIVTCLLDIYNRTGRIVVDALGEGNILKTPQGQLICVDVGLALRLDKENVRVKGMLREKSFTSLHTWRRAEDKYWQYYENFLDPLVPKYRPRAVEICKALIVLKAHFPNIIDASFLDSKPKISALLAKVFDGYKSSLAEAAERISIRTNPVAEQLLDIKQFCVKELETYIESRGIPYGKNRFHPSFITTWFRDLELTKAKVKLAQDLIVQIKKAESVKVISDLLTEFRKHPLIFKSIFSSGIEESIVKCDAELQFMVAH